MVLVRFGNGAEWSKANWVFRKLAGDIAEAFPDDSELKQELERAEAFGLLDVDVLEQDAATRIVQAIESIARATMQGRLPSWEGTKPNDAKGQGAYREAIAELIPLIQGRADRLSH